MVRPSAVPDCTLGPASPGGPRAEGHPAIAEQHAVGAAGAGGGVVGDPR